MTDRPRPPSRTPFLLAALLSLAWVAAILWAVARGHLPVLTPADALALVALILSPLALPWALAAALLARNAAIGAAIDPLAVHGEGVLEATEQRLTGIVSRMDAVRSLLQDDLAAIRAAADALETRGAAAHAALVDATAAAAAASDAGRALEAALPAVRQQSEAVQQAMTAGGAETERQATLVASLARTLAERQAELAQAAQVTGGVLNEALAALESRATATRAHVEGQAVALKADADAAFAATEAATAAMRDGVAAQSAALAASLQSAQSSLTQIGNDAARAISARLDSLAGQAATLEARLAAQGAAVDQLSANADRAFKVLDGRLDHSARQTEGNLDRLDSRLAASRAAIDSLGEPMRDAQAAAEALDAAVARLKAITLDTVDALGATLPERTVEASRAAETMTSELTALVRVIEAAHEKAAALAAPIHDSKAALLAAADDFARQRDNVETAGQALVVELNQAKQLIAEVNDATDATSLAAATRLVDAMNRVRDVAAQAAGTMRDTLAGVIEEARTGLADAAGDATRKAFVTPIREQAEAAVAASEAAGTRAQAVVGRVAASIAALAETLALMDAKVAARDAELGVSSNEALVAAAAALNDRLAQAGIDLTRAMGATLSDADWTAWAKGERGLFGRRAVELTAKSDRTALSALAARDPDFNAAARRYIGDFEALTSRFTGDRRGETLIALLRDGPQGRLAAALTEALD
ncbi:hypothetical protein [Sandaracinobacteroides saxicola]|uniref:Apolipoprotein A1/A4/E domain-containing protein n=1 Tax=Sandaracinobacteroides saxicola TaxID=2759707 RepID=A0A7G5IEP2_9SPHN|nr:hypothetical protein [Sandaracinobacteroides saxicola]QMW21834.1 hypothetical protein H3309_10550 [Sandaracinobacteroides saxicola]